MGFCGLWPSIRQWESWKNCIRAGSVPMDWWTPGRMEPMSNGGGWPRVPYAAAADQDLLDLKLLKWDDSDDSDDSSFVDIWCIFFNVVFVILKTLIWLGIFDMNAYWAFISTPDSWQIQGSLGINGLTHPWLLTWNLNLWGCWVFMVEYPVPRPIFTCICSGFSMVL